MRQLLTKQFPVSMTWLVIVLNLVAFAPALVNTAGRTVPLPLSALDLVHVLVSVAWLFVFLAQVSLISGGRPVVHRRVGVLGALLTVALIVVTWLMLVEGAQRGFDLSGDLIPRGTTVDPGFFLAPAHTLISFGMLVAAAVWYRRRPVVHKRLMLLALVNTTGAPVAHMIGHWPALRALAFLVGAGSYIVLLLLLLIHDRLSLGHVHRVSLWAGAASFLWTPLFFILVAPTSAWRRFAEWVVQ